MQSLHIVHRDLKPLNVLIDADGHLVITDFGLSGVDAALRDQHGLFISSKEEEIYYENVGTDGYKAPEVYQGGYTYAADMWSLGVIIFEMFWGKPYFSDDFNAEQEIQDNLRLLRDITSCVEPEALELVIGLLQLDPLRRCTSIKQIKKNRFFRDIDWRSLEKKLTKGPVIPPPAQPVGTWKEALTLPGPPLILMTRWHCSAKW
ncbi:kinase-like protein, partial [Dentipellis sp. KUC8613]